MTGGRSKVPEALAVGAIEQDAGTRVADRERLQPPAVSRADVACRGRTGVAMAGRPALRGPSHRSRKQKRLGSARRLFCRACRRGRRHDVVSTPDEPQKARSGASWRPSEKATWFEAPASGPEARGPESRRSTRDGTQAIDRGLRSIRLPTLESPHSSPSLRAPGPVGAVRAGPERPCRWVTAPKDCASRTVTSQGRS